MKPGGKKKPKMTARKAAHQKYLDQVEQKKREIKAARDENIRRREPDLNNLYFRDSLFQADHAQSVIEETLELDEARDGDPDAEVDEEDECGFIEIVKAIRKAQGDMPDVVWSQFVADMNSSHFAEDELFEAIVEVEPSWQQFSSKEKRVFLWLSPHGPTEEFERYFYDRLQWISLKPMERKSVPEEAPFDDDEEDDPPNISPKSSRTDPPSPKPTRSLSSANPGLEDDDDEEEEEEEPEFPREADCVWVDVCKSEEIMEQRPCFDPRGLGLDLENFPLFSHTGLTGCDTSAEIMLRQLRDYMYEALLSLKTDGYLCIMWHCSIVHPMLVWLKVQLEPLFSRNAVIPHPTEIGMVLLIMGRFKNIDEDCQKFLSFLRHVQRAEGIDDVLAWTLSTNDALDELRGEDWDQAMYDQGQTFGKLVDTRIEQFRDAERRKAEEERLAKIGAAAAAKKRAKPSRKSIVRKK